MASAGTVTLNLDANSVKLLRELQKSQRATRRAANNMQRRMGSAFRSIRRSVLSATSALAAFGAFRGLTRVIDEIDQIGKMVDRLGGSTQAFSELQFVAERSGLAFNTLTMGLQRMQRRVAEAAEGFGEAKGALRELNINAQAITRLPIDQQFEVIADALSRVAEEGDRTRLAMKLFDSEGVALLQTMRDGAQGIRDLRDEARRLGISLDEDQVAAATRANDAMTRMRAAVEGLARDLTVKLAPAIELVANRLSLMASGGASNPARDLEILREAYKALQEQIAKDGPGLFGFRERELKRLTALMTPLEIELIRIANHSDVAGDEIEELGEIMVSVAKKTDIYAEDLKKFADRFQTAEMRADALRQALKRFQGDLDPAQIRMVKDEINEILTGGLEEIDISRLPKMKVLEEETNKVKDAVNSLGLTFSSAFEDAIVEGKKLRDVLQGIFKDILRILIRKSITEPLGNALASAFGGAFGGARASGGPVSSGSSYLVGENGPELFTPGRSGYIHPRGGGAVNISYNIDNRGADSSAVSRIAPMLERTKNATIAEVRLLLREGRLS